MQPVVHGLETQFTDQIEFVYLNIDDPNTADEKQQYGFRYQPHFILVDGNGQVVEEWFGYVPEDTFTTAFNNLLSN